MTLTPFPPEALDALSLRLLDVAVKVREMANDSRETAVPGFQLHGNKIHEWLVHLEDWTHDGAAKLQTALIKHKGQQRAQTVATPGSGIRRRGSKKS